MHIVKISIWLFLITSSVSISECKSFRKYLVPKNLGTNNEFNDNCFCFKQSGDYQKVPEILNPDKHNLERLVIYLYKDTITMQVKMYIPHEEKQALVPDLAFEVGDRLITIEDDVKVIDVFNINSEYKYQIIESKEVFSKEIITQDKSQYNLWNYDIPLYVDTDVLSLENNAQNEYSDEPKVLKDIELTDDVRPINLFADINKLPSKEKNIPISIDNDNYHKPNYDYTNIQSEEEKKSGETVQIDHHFPHEFDVDHDEYITSETINTDTPQNKPNVDTYKVPLNHLNIIPDDIVQQYNHFPHELDVNHKEYTTDETINTDTPQNKPNVDIYKVPSNHLNIIPGEIVQNDIHFPHEFDVDPDEYITDETINTDTPQNKPNVDVYKVPSNHLNVIPGEVVQSDIHFPHEFDVDPDEYITGETINTQTPQNKPNVDIYKVPSNHLNIIPGEIVQHDNYFSHEFDVDHDEYITSETINTDTPKNKPNVDTYKVPSNHLNFIPGEVVQSDIHFPHEFDVDPDEYITDETINTDTPQNKPNVDVYKVPSNHLNIIPGEIVQHDNHFPHEFDVDPDEYITGETINTDTPQNKPNVDVYKVPSNHLNVIPGEVVQSDIHFPHEFDVDPDEYIPDKTKNTQTPQNKPNVDIYKVPSNHLNIIPGEIVQHDNYFSHEFDVDHDEYITSETINTDTPQNKPNVDTYKVQSNHLNFIPGEVVQSDIHFPHEFDVDPDEYITDLTINTDTPQNKPNVDVYKVPSNHLNIIPGEIVQHDNHFPHEFDVDPDEYITSETINTDTPQNKPNVDIYKVPSNHLNIIPGEIVQSDIHFPHEFDVDPDEYITDETINTDTPQNKPNVDVYKVPSNHLNIIPGEIVQHDNHFPHEFDVDPDEYITGETFNTDTPQNKPNVDVYKVPSNHLNVIPGEVVQSDIHFPHEFDVDPDEYITGETINTQTPQNKPNVDIYKVPSNHLNIIPGEIVQHDNYFSHEFDVDHDEYITSETINTDTPQNKPNVDTYKVPSNHLNFIPGEVVQSDIHFPHEFDVDPDEYITDETINTDTPQNKPNVDVYKVPSNHLNIIPGEIVQHDNHFPHEFDVDPDEYITSETINTDTPQNKPNVDIYKVPSNHLNIIPGEIVQNDNHFPHEFDVDPDEYIPDKTKNTQTPQNEPNVDIYNVPSNHLNVIPGEIVQYDNHFPHEFDVDPDEYITDKTINTQTPQNKPNVDTYKVPSNHLNFIPGEVVQSDIHIPHEFDVDHDEYITGETINTQTPQNKPNVDIYKVPSNHLNIIPGEIVQHENYFSHEFDVDHDENITSETINTDTPQNKPNVDTYKVPSNHLNFIPGEVVQSDIHFPHEFDVDPDEYITDETINTDTPQNKPNVDVYKVPSNHLNIIPGEIVQHDNHFPHEFDVDPDEYIPDKTKNTQTPQNKPNVDIYNVPSNHLNVIPGEIVQYDNHFPHEFDVDPDEYITDKTINTQTPQNKPNVDIYKVPSNHLNIIPGEIVQNDNHFPHEFDVDPDEYIPDKTKNTQTPQNKPNVDIYNVPSNHLNVIPGEIVQYDNHFPHEFDVDPEEYITDKTINTLTPQNKPNVDIYNVPSNHLNIIPGEIVQHDNHFPHEFDVDHDEYITGETINTDTPQNKPNVDIYKVPSNHLNVIPGEIVQHDNHFPHEFDVDPDEYITGETINTDTPQNKPNVDVYKVPSNHLNVIPGEIVQHDNHFPHEFDVDPDEDITGETINTDTPQNKPNVDIYKVPSNHLKVIPGEIVQHDNHFPHEFDVDPDEYITDKTINTQTPQNKPNVDIYKVPSNHLNIIPGEIVQNDNHFPHEFDVDPDEYITGETFNTDTPQNKPNVDIYKVPSNHLNIIPGEIVQNDNHFPHEFDVDPDEYITDKTINIDGVGHYGQYKPHSNKVLSYDSDKVMNVYPTKVTSKEIKILDGDIHIYDDSSIEHTYIESNFKEDIESSKLYEQYSESNGEINNSNEVYDSSASKENKSHQHNHYETFDTWFIQQMQRFKTYTEHDRAINLQTIERYILKILLDNDMHVTSEGVLTDSFGTALDVHNLYLRPILIGNTMTFGSILNDKVKDLVMPKNMAYLQAILITNSSPSMILGIIPIGKTVIPPSAVKLNAFSTLLKPFLRNKIKWKSPSYRNHYSSIGIGPITYNDRVINKANKEYVGGNKPILLHLNGKQNSVNQKSGKTVITVLKKGPVLVQSQYNRHPVKTVEVYGTNDFFGGEEYDIESAEEVNKLILSIREGRDPVESAEATNNILSSLRSGNGSAISIESEESEEISVDEEDIIERIVGGHAATSSGTPLSIKGRMKDF